MTVVEAGISYEPLRGGGTAIIEPEQRWIARRGDVPVCPF